MLSQVAAADYIRRHGTLVASFENEPPNVVALSKVFPDAMHVFVDTVCSDLGAMPVKAFIEFGDFTSWGRTQATLAFTSIFTFGSRIGRYLINRSLVKSSK